MIKPSNCSPEVAWETLYFEVAGTIPDRTALFDPIRGSKIVEMTVSLDGAGAPVEDIYLQFSSPNIPAGAYGTILAIPAGWEPQVLRTLTDVILVPPNVRLQMNYTPEISPSTIHAVMHWHPEDYSTGLPAIGGVG